MLKKFSWEELLIISNLLAIAVWILYIFGIITPLFGNIFVQFTWFVVFFSLAVKKLSNSKNKPKFFTVIATLTLIILLQLINFAGSVFEISLYPPTKIENCKDRNIYYQRNELGVKGPLDYTYSESILPILYFKINTEINQSIVGLPAQNTYLVAGDCVFKRPAPL